MSNKFTQNSESPSNKKVLILEDELAIAKMLKKMLKRLGCNSDISLHGEDAINKFSKAHNRNPYDLVVLDVISKQGMGGLETFKHLQKIDPKVNAIASSSSILERLDEFGFKGVLSKPFTFSELNTVLSNILDK